MKKLLLLLIGASTVFVSCQKDELEAQANTITALESNVSVLQANLSDTQAQLADANATIEENNSEIAALGADLDAARISIAGLEGDVAGLEEDLALLQAQYDALVIELAEANEALEAATTELASVKSALDSANGDISQLETRLGNAQAEIAAAQARCDALAAELVEARANVRVVSGGTRIVRVEVGVQWAPAFAAQTADFTQTAEGGSREVSVTSSNTLRTVPQNAVVTYTVDGGASSREAAQTLANTNQADVILTITTTSTPMVFTDVTYSFTVSGTDVAYSHTIEGTVGVAGSVSTDVVTETIEFVDNTPAPVASFPVYSWTLDSDSLGVTWTAGTATSTAASVLAADAPAPAASLLPANTRYVDGDLHTDGSVAIEAIPAGNTVIPGTHITVTAVGGTITSSANDIYAITIVQGADVTISLSGGYSPEGFTALSSSAFGLDGDLSGLAVGQHQGVFTSRRGPHAYTAYVNVTVTADPALSDDVLGQWSNWAPIASDVSAPSTQVEITEERTRSFTQNGALDTVYAGTVPSERETRTVANPAYSAPMASITVNFATLSTTGAFTHFGSVSVNGTTIELDNNAGDATKENTATVMAAAGDVLSFTFGQGGGSTGSYTVTQADVDAGSIVITINSQLPAANAIVRG